MKYFRSIYLKRLFFKTFLYRFLSGILTFFGIFIFTHSISISLFSSIGIEIIKTFWYFLFDYYFNKKYKLSEDQGFVLWTTGVSAVGKSTLMDAVQDELKKYDRKVERLDGDIVRQGLSSDLGFSKKDRNSNIKRNAFVAKLLSRNGVCVLCSFISPYRKVRQYVKENVTNFIEVHVIASKQTCMDRDPKGLYKKAKERKIKNLTGFDGEYEKPFKADITINTEHSSLQESVKVIIDELKRRRLI